MTNQAEDAVEAVKKSVLAAIGKKSITLPRLLRILFQAALLQEQGDLPFLENTISRRSTATSAEALDVFSKFNDDGHKVAGDDIVGNSLFLEPNSWADSAVCTPDDVMLCHEPVMTFPAFDRHDGRGFYDCYRPETWTPVRDVLAGGPVSSINYGFYPHRDNLPRGFMLAGFASVFEARRRDGGAEQSLADLSPALAHLFQRSHSCLANYLPLSSHLGSWRCEDRLVGNMPDVFLRMVKAWYFGGDGLHKEAQEAMDENRDYLFGFGKGTDGRKCQRNYLIGSFVESNYDVIEFVHRQLPIDMAGSGAFRPLPTNLAQTLKYINSSLKAWSARSDSLARSVHFEEFERYIASTAGCA